MLSLLPLLVGLQLLFGQCMANTETYLTEVPLYFNIPLHPHPIPAKARLSRDLHQINQTHAVLLDYPIEFLGSSKGPISNTIEASYDTLSGFKAKTSSLHTLLVRINNYEDSSYESRDLLSVKVCWPATYPYDFSISHRFLTEAEAGLPSPTHKHLELFVQIDYRFKGQTYDPGFLSSEDSVPFQLYINRLPSRYIPIPLELYPFIVYLVDVLILSTQVVPMVADLVW